MPLANKLSRAELKPIIQMTVALWFGTSLFWGVPDLLSCVRIPLRVGVEILFDIAVGLALCSVFLVTTLWLRERPVLVRRAGVAMLAASLAIAHAYIDAEIMLWLNALSGFPGSPFMTIFSSILIDYVLIYLLFAASVSLLLTQFELRKRDQRLARAELTAQQAQLAALRLQLNPHFLFNSLNALSSLVVTGENARAERMIGLITNFLRSTLVSQPREQATVADELANISDYLEIELVRFEDRLTLEFHCPPELGEALFPSHLLQPIVENAIKHGVARSSNPVTLSIEVTAPTRRELRVRVSDDAEPKAGATRAEGTGTGLANVQERLAIFHGDQASFHHGPTARGYEVVMQLPLRFAQASNKASRAA
jgi:signal transduction histidine kinase